MIIGMQSNLQDKGVLEVAGFGSVSSSEAKWKRQGSCGTNEPISVLDTRSLSPSTSTSTLSSSLGGGGGTGGGSSSTENTTSLAAVSDNTPQQKWPVSMPPESGPAVVTESAGAGGRKDEWASELQQIPDELEVSGCERFGLGLEDWDSLLPESGPDQSILRWIAGEVDDASFGLKQLLQGVFPTETSGNVALGIVDQGSTFEPASAGGCTGNAMSTVIPLSSCAGSPSSSLGTGNSKSANLGLNNHHHHNPQIPIFGSSIDNNPFPGLAIYQQQLLETPDDEKPQIFNHHECMNQPPPPSQITPSQNLFPPPSLYPQQDPLFLLQPPQKRLISGLVDPRSQIPKLPFLDSGHEFLLGKQPSPPLGLGQQIHSLPPLHLQQKPLMVPKQEFALERTAAHQQQQQHQQVIYDHLYKAAELILAGNFSHAQGILARLNHQLSPLSKPFQRAAFYFKEALQLPLLMPNPASSLPPRNPTPFDGMFKMGAYKLLSEVSPLIQFMNFTSNQALLEALNDAERIHLIDFDIGFGAQWASFMQELPGRKRDTPVSLKITAFASPSTHHPLELGLMHENLTQFATEMGINFELEVVNFDDFDPSSYWMPPSKSPNKEAIAVNFPIWACSSRPSVLPSLLRFIKQLSPKIVVSLERGCERADLPFSHHLLHAVQYYESLLDSVDASNANSETMNKIERFLFQPRIESIVLGRLHSPKHMPHWKSLFASTGFSPVSFSNFTETQAECILKRSQLRGFHLGKRQGSLVLYWQHRELVSASAWSC